MPHTGLNVLLLVETGGTHTRCAVSHGGGGPEHVVVFKNAGYPNLESVIADYLDTPGMSPPSRAALAVAAPTHVHPLELTNLGWSVDTLQLEHRFGWRDASVVNDFEALACAVPMLADEELSTIRAGEPVSNMPVGLLGPGTGLGVSGLVPCAGAWYPINGEGGHVTLAAADDAEAEILRALRRSHGHVSAERVLCGAGLLRLYRLIASAATADSPDEITRLANQGDEAALQTLELFFRFLGTVAGDLALTLGARGGIYLGGGILPRVRRHLLASGFGQRFIDKGRFSEYLETIPVYLIEADTPALRGLARHPLVAPPVRTASSDP